MTDGKALLTDLQALPNCEPLANCTSDVNTVPIPKLRGSSAVTCAKATCHFELRSITCHLLAQHRSDMALGLGKGGHIL